MFLYHILQRSRVLPILHFLPVHILKEIVTANLTQIDPLLRILLQQPQKQVPKTGTHVAYLGVYSLIKNFTLQRKLVILHRQTLTPITTPKRTLPEEQLEHEHSQSPQISLLTKLATALKGLRRHVFEGSHKGGNRLLVLDDDLGESIVSQLYVSILGNQQVFRLELPIYDSKAMQDGDSNNDLCDDCPHEGLREGDFLLAEVEIEITHGEILHNDVDVVLVLEGLPDAHQELLLPHLLHQPRLHHVELLNLRFLDDFHGEQPPRLFLLGQNHAAEVPTTEIFPTLVVFRSP